MTGLVAYARCPLLGYWTFVDPLPRKANPAARVGSVVHGWIERRSAGQGSLLDDVPAIPVMKPTRRPGLPRSGRLSCVAYADGGPGRWSALRPVVCGPWVVRGRVDAVYDRDAGRSRSSISRPDGDRRPTIRSAGLQWTATPWPPPTAGATRRNGCGPPCGTWPVGEGLGRLRCRRLG